MGPLERAKGLAEIACSHCKRTCVAAERHCSHTYLGVNLLCAPGGLQSHSPRLVVACFGVLPSMTWWMNDGGLDDVDGWMDCVSHDWPAGWFVRRRGSVASIGNV